MRYGFSRVVDFIRYTINGTNAKLVLKEPSDYRIVAKKILLQNIRMLITFVRNQKFILQKTTKNFFQG